MKIKNRVIWILLPIAISFVTFILSYKKPYYLIGDETPITFNKVSIRTSSDQAQKGNSEIRLLEKKYNRLKYRYVLREGATWKFANLLFFSNDESPFNLKGYDYIKVKMQASKGQRIPFFISTVAKLKNRKKDEVITEDLFTNLNVSDSSVSYTIQISTMLPPDWWYISRGLKETDLENPDLSKVTCIGIASCLNIPINMEDVVEIEELSFHVDYLPLLIYTAVFDFLYYAVLVSLLYYKKRKVSSEIKINYEKIEVQSHQSKEEELVFSFIHKNYSNPDLVITDIQNETGIHERKVSTLVKNKKGISFKAYLNNLRISEAKSLLTKTNLSISEIAFKVGYGNASHFSRVFKLSEHCSPNDFRKKHQNHLQSKTDS